MLANRIRSKPKKPKRKILRNFFIVRVLRIKYDPSFIKITTYLESSQIINNPYKLKSKFIWLDLEQVTQKVEQALAPDSSL